MEVGAFFVRFYGRQVGFQFVFRNDCLFRLYFGEDDPFAIRFCAIRNGIMGIPCFLDSAAYLILDEHRFLGGLAGLLTVILNGRVG